MLYKIIIIITLKLNFTLEQATKTQSLCRGIAHSSFNLGVRWAGSSTIGAGRFTPEKDPAPIV